MGYKLPQTDGIKSEGNDTAQSVVAVESTKELIQRVNNEFVLSFTGRLSLRSKDWKKSAEFQQDWRTVADPSFEHLTFGTNNTDDDTDSTNTFACPFMKHNPETYRDWKCCNTWNGWPTVRRVK